MHPTEYSSALKKGEGHITIWDSMNEPGKHCTKWHNPGKEDIHMGIIPLVCNFSVTLLEAVQRRVVA